MTKLLGKNLEYSTGKGGIQSYPGGTPVEKLSEEALEFAEKNNMLVDDVQDVESYTHNPDVVTHSISGVPQNLSDGPSPTEEFLNTPMNKTIGEQNLEASARAEAHSVLVDAQDQRAKERLEAQEGNALGNASGESGTARVVGTGEGRRLVDDGAPAVTTETLGGGTVNFKDANDAARGGAFGQGQNPDTPFVHTTAVIDPATGTNNPSGGIGHLGPTHGLSGTPDGEPANPDLNADLPVGEKLPDAGLNSDLSGTDNTSNVPPSDTTADLADAQARQDAVDADVSRGVDPAPVNRVSTEASDEGFSALNKVENESTDTSASADADNSGQADSEDAKSDAAKKVTTTTKIGAKKS